MSIIAGNFKANLTRKSSKLYINKLNDYLIKENVTNDIFLFLPPSSLDEYSIVNNLHIGVQNFYPKENGAFTGETCYEQLREFNINTMLIGHSERRTLFNEDKELLENKLKFAIEQKFNIIYCIGESLNTKNAGTIAVSEHIKEQLSIVDNTYDKMIVAYEPIWSIGTGKTSSIDDISSMMEIIKNLGIKKVLYGGSVNSSNCADICAVNGCDGLLIGGASLDVNSMVDIIKKTRNI